MSVGAAAWLTTDSDQFYIDMALRSYDSRYDGKRPRLRVSCARHPADPPLTTPIIHPAYFCTTPLATILLSRARLCNLPQSVCQFPCVNVYKNRGF